MLSVAVVVTDISDYLKENFSNGKEMVFYELDHLEELPSIIQSLQENPVRSGKNCGKWKARGTETAYLDAARDTDGRTDRGISTEKQRTLKQMQEAN